MYDIGIYIYIYIYIYIVAAGVLKYHYTVKNTH